MKKNAAEKYSRVLFIANMMSKKHLIFGGYRQERIKKAKKKKLFLKKISF